METEIGWELCLLFELLKNYYISYKYLLSFWKRWNFMPSLQENKQTKIAELIFQWSS